MALLHAPSIGVVTINYINNKEVKVWIAGFNASIVVEVDGEAEQLPYDPQDLANWIANQLKQDQEQ